MSASRPSPPPFSSYFWAINFSICERNCPRNLNRLADLAGGNGTGCVIDDAMALSTHSIHRLDHLGE